MFSRRSPATSPRHLSPLPSPSRSRSNSATSQTTSLGYYEPSCRPVRSEEALKVVKGLEQVISAWDEYRLAVANQGRAGRKLAATMRDLQGRLDKDGVAYHTLKPTARTIDDLSENTLRYAKRVGGTYDHANIETSRYFQDLARQVRDHEAFLANEGKRAVKSEKAYRKASKIMTDGAIHGSGLEAMKDALKLEVERANLDHANLLGDAQAAILFKVSAALAGMVGPTVEYHSDGLKTATERYGEIEHFKALAGAGWRDLALPELIGDQHETAMTTEPLAIQQPIKTGKQLELEPDKAYPQPKCSLVRPKLPSPYPSSQTTIRTRHSLPPPPMYVSTSSLSIPRISDVGAASPTQSTSSIHSPGAKPLIPSPARRRVSDIAAELESLAQQSKETPPVPVRPDALRRVSMPPVLGGSPSGPRPISVRPLSGIPGAPKPTETSYTSPTTSYSNTSSGILLSPSSLPGPDTPQKRRGMGLSKKQQVSFASDEGSFPWHLSSSLDSMDVKLRGKDVGEEGMIQPSPRRVPSLSPELRGLMAG